jgi:hypothetical protein
LFSVEFDRGFSCANSSLGHGKGDDRHLGGGEVDFVLLGKFNVLEIHKESIFVRSDGV